MPRSPQPNSKQIRLQRKQKLRRKKQKSQQNLHEQAQSIQMRAPWRSLGSIVHELNQQRKKELSTPEVPKTEYQLYLESEHWRLFRLRIIAKRGARCERCGSDRQIDLHHLTYARRGHERDEDVKILCHRCHQAVHHFSPISNKPITHFPLTINQKTINHKTINQKTIN